jgi:hypothetical protein
VEAMSWNRGFDIRAYDHSMIDNSECVTLARLRRVQRLRNVSDQIGRVFNADRQPDR